MSSLVVEEKFICFYTTPPVWVGAKPAFFDSLPNQIKNLYEEMAKCVHEQRIKDIHLRISYDGLIELRKTGLEKKLNPGDDAVLEHRDVTSSYSEYLRIVNALFVCLDIGCMEATCSSPFHFEEIRRRDFSRATYVDGRFRSSNLATHSVAGFYHAGRFPTAYRAERLLSKDPRFYQRPALGLAALDLGLKYFEKIYSIPSMVDKLATYAKALSEFNTANFSTGVVLCWFLLEQALMERYEAFLKEQNASGAHYIDKERHGYLTGRDFSAAVVTQFLELNGRLTYIELARLDSIRRFRNNIAHNLGRKVPGFDDCEKALEFTLGFILADIIKDPRVCLFTDLRDRWP